MATLVAVYLIHVCILYIYIYIYIYLFIYLFYLSIYLFIYLFIYRTSLISPFASTLQRIYWQRAVHWLTGKILKQQNAKAISESPLHNGIVQICFDAIDKFSPGNQSYLF